jgi:hypothetical protein
LGPISAVTEPRGTDRFNGPKTKVPRRRVRFVRIRACVIAAQVLSDGQKEKAQRILLCAFPVPIRSDQTE